MTMPSFRDVEQLSAYLDGQLSQAEKARLEIRIQSDPVLAATLDDLRQARTLLRHTPKRRVPRNFTLTPKMAGIKPPVPRLVPALSWASAVAMLLFVFTLGANLVGQLSFGAAAPMLAAAPAARGGGQPDNTQTYGINDSQAAATSHPAATQPPVKNGTALATPTTELSPMVAPELTPSEAMRAMAPPAAPKAQPEPTKIWPFIWLGLAVLLVGAAFFVRWSNQQAFEKKSIKK